MDFLSTVNGSLLEGFYPSDWDLKRIDEYCEKGVTMEKFWHKDFQPVECDSLSDIDTFMGHGIALNIKKARDNGEKLAMILPVGPMGMYKWAVYFLKEWDVNCDHVYTFNMDEWADSEGNTLPLIITYRLNQFFISASEKLFCKPYFINGETFAVKIV